MAKSTTGTKSVFSQEELAALKDVEKKFARTGRMYETGHSLPRITETLAEILGSNNIQVQIPYSTFVCRGKAIDVDADVKGLMPFSKTRKTEDQCTTLFYGENRISRSNYIPFQASNNVYHISSIEVVDGCVNVRLEKGNNSGMFM